MRILICGAGQVGWQAARQLAREDNDIVLVDLDDRLIRQANESLDAQGVAGNVCHPDVLEQAGAADADLLIAATGSDEANIVACEIAHALFQVPRCIARLRAPVYFDPRFADLFRSDRIPIDAIISPEQEIAAAALARLAVPTAFDSESFMDGRLRMLGLALTQDCPLLGVPLRQMEVSFSGLAAVVVGVRRGARLFAPDPNDQLFAGDQAFVIVPPAQIERTLSAFGLTPRAIRTIVIVGAGNIGLAVAQAIERRGDIGLTLIERNRARAELAADRLQRSVVLNGDGLDSAILAEAGVGGADMALTLTQDDQANILTAVRARLAGAGRVVALINDPALIPLSSAIGIDAQVSPRAATVSSILRHVRRGRVRDVYAIGDGEAELIEAQVLAGSAVAGRPLSEIELPRGARIAAVEKGGQVLSPRPELRLEQGDLILIFALSGDVSAVERLLQVAPDWF